MDVVGRARMNLSETAFLVRRSDGFDLRWFTPAIEVDLCGHATLASAHHAVGNAARATGPDAAVSHQERRLDRRSPRD
jgi:PhzF family phenazine biosynthesis protein